MDAYKNEYAESVKLFEKALEGYHKSTLVQQKAKYKDAMDKALPIINELVSCILKREGGSMEIKLNTDYQKYMESGKEDDFKNVQGDIKSLKP